MTEFANPACGIAFCFWLHRRLPMHAAVQRDARVKNHLERNRLAEISSQFVLFDGFSR
jgi:hypothetical protein